MVDLGPNSIYQNKPTKYGVKAFTLADSLNGYILDVLLYTGADTLDNSNPSYPDLPKPAQTVMALTKDYLNEGRTIFTDRYYTSIPLLQELESQLTSFTGTCMKNRQQIPKNFRQKSFRLSDDEVQAYRSGRFMALAWRSPSKKKGIIMLSSKDSAQMTSVTSRATHRISEKPVVVDNYNQSMNGVDLADQYTVYYSFIRKSKKWWKKVCFWLLEVAMVNSYILFKFTNSSYTHVQYRKSVVESLAKCYFQEYPSRAVRGRPFRQSLTEGTFVGDTERLNRRQHFLGKREQRQCVVCSTHQKRHRSSFFCKTCPSNPTLCPDACNEKYHTEVNFK